MAPAEDRLAMCRLVAAAHPKLSVSDLEITRGGASFTADTLETLEGQYPDTEWYLITGADMFLTLGTWWRFEDIAELAVLCAAPPGTATLASCRRTPNAGGKRRRCRVEDIPVMDISSTDIRERAGGRGGRWRGGFPVRWRTISGKRAYTVAARRGRRYRWTSSLSRSSGGGKAKSGFRHSLAVADEAARLAEKYGADPAKARTAGILHDILKDAGQDAQLQIFKDFAILLDNVEQQAPKLWHAGRARSSSSRFYR